MSVAVMCNATAGMCVCRLDADHESPHICESESCGGSWEDRLGPFRVVRFPRSSRASGLLGKERTE